MAAPVRPPPPAPQRPAPEPPPALAADLPPAARYRLLLDALPPISRATLADNAAFLTFSDGRLTLAVRSVLGQTRVRNELNDLDIGAYFPGFRVADVRIDMNAGRTGNERRTAGEDKRVADAVAAAEASPILKRLVTCFAGKVESIVPVGDVPRDMNMPELESDDE